MAGNNAIAVRQILGLLPTPAAKHVKTAIAGLQLKRVARKSFDTRNLRFTSRKDLDGAFTDPQIEAAFATDSKIMEGAVQSGPGVTSGGQRRAIYHLVATLRPVSVLEVGTHRGASTVTIARALATHSGPDALLTTLDIVDVNAFSKGRVTPADAVASIGLLDRVQFLTIPVIDFLKTTSDRFDLIFLDGDHAATAVYSEVSAALTVLKPQGVILLHDYHPGNRHVFSSGNPIPGPYLAMERMKSEGNNIDVLPFGNLPWPSRWRSSETASCLAVVTLARPS